MLWSCRSEQVAALSARPGAAAALRSHADPKPRRSRHSQQLDSIYKIGHCTTTAAAQAEPHQRSQDSTRGQRVLSTSCYSHAHNRDHAPLTTSDKRQLCSSAAEPVTLRRSAVCAAVAFASCQEALAPEKMPG